MTATAKPLNVRVAEALGLRVRDDSVYGCQGQCVGSVDDSGAFPTAGRLRHNHIRWVYWKAFEWEAGEGDWESVLPYGEDSPDGWACTGPLIAKHGIELLCNPYGDGNYVARRSRDFDWPTFLVDGRDPFASARTHVEAVALLIVALSEIGRLQPK